LKVIDSKSDRKDDNVKDEGAPDPRIVQSDQEESLEYILEDCHGIIYLELL